MPPLVEPPAPAQPVRRGSNPETWVAEYGDDLFRFALVRLRDRSGAEDLVQETFLAALKAPASFRGEATERNWLMGILKNKIADYFRKLARETSLANVEFLQDVQAESLRKSVPDAGRWGHGVGPKEWVAMESSLERQEFWETLNDCSGKLPRNVAQVYAMREIDEVSAEKICAHLQISPANLWVMLHRARAALRRCLEIHWFGREAK